jgi:hypothetical protein
MQKFGVEYKVNEWRLLMDSSKRSLKAVLLHNGNYTSLPIGHSVQLKEGNEDLELFLTKLGFTAHDWIICGDLKLVCMILGQQAGYTKYPYFMCEWDNTARSQNWEQKHWTQGHLLNLGARIFCAKIMSIRRKYCSQPFILN